MKLQSFGIANFKAFSQDIQRMPLKPITLVFGPNSAGKSSLIHSWLWLNHAMTTGEANVRIPIGGKKQVDLGGYNQCIHRHDSLRRMIVELTFSKPQLPESMRAFWNIDTEVVLDISFGRFPGGMEGSVHLVDYRLRIDGKDFISAIRTNEGLSISIIDLTHSAIAGRIHQNATQTESDIASEYKMELTGLIPNGIRYQGALRGDIFWDMILPKQMNELVETITQLATDATAFMCYVPL